MKTTDVAIVGGGVVGSAVAYFLSASSVFDGTVTVVERDPTYEFASTPRSCGGLRQQFSNRENVEIGLFGHQFVTHVGDYLSVDGVSPDVAWREGGYLFLASEPAMDTLRENTANQKGLGANIVVLKPEELKRVFPWLHVDDLAGGSLSLAGEGWLDPNSLMMAFRAKARSLGVDYLHGEVGSIEVSGSQVISVGLNNGTKIGCGSLVNAAGANAGPVAALAGVALPVVPRKRTIYVIDCREPLNPPSPLLIDKTGVFVRPEGAGYICGVSPPEDCDPDAWDDLEVDNHWFEEMVWPTLAHRIPSFEAIKLISAWAGWYDYNTIDQNGIVGRHPEIRNLIFANGFSGHGLQQSPAVGRAVMELVTGNEFLTINLKRFGYERIAERRLLIEKNVV
mgnify:CR=1 FL=1